MIKLSRQIKPYKRKKGSKKQKNQLNSFNQFTDELIDTYFTPIDNKKNIKKKNK